MHWAYSGTRSTFFVRENGQPERVIESPYQPFRCATTARAARQCEAWLSPTSAIVPVAFARGVPNAQTWNGRVWTNRHGAFGRLIAAMGVGTTANFSFGLLHACRGSRAAAPKHFGRE